MNDKSVILRQAPVSISFPSPLRFRLHFITPGQVAGQEKKTEKRKEKKGYDNNVTISHAAVSSL
jgi:hypothetical protein